MKTIVVGFSKPIRWKPFAWMIQTLYSIPYDHVYIKITSTLYQRELIYQASHMAVNFVGTTIFTEENAVIDEFPVSMTDENYVAMMQFAIDNVGKAYGIKAALGLGIVQLFNMFGKKISNPFTDGGKTYVCSELASFILSTYTDVKSEKPMEEASPLDVYNSLMKLKPLK